MAINCDEEANFLMSLSFKIIVMYLGHFDVWATEKFELRMTNPK